MAITLLQLVNSALRRIGQRSVSNIDSPSTREENIVSDIKEMTIREVLSEHRWNGPTKRVRLGVDVADEVQTVTVDATGGTFTLTFKNQTTDALAFDITASDLESALEGLTSIESGNVSVSGGPGDSGGNNPYTVTFQEDLSEEEVPLMTGDGGNLTGGAGTVTIAESTKGKGAGFEFDNAFRLPSDYVRLHYTSKPESPHKLTETHILSDEDELHISYVYFTEDPDVMGPHLRKALSYKFSAELAQAMTGDPKRYQMMDNKYQDALAEARFHDSSQEGISTVGGSNWLDARTEGADGDTSKLHVGESV